MMTAPTNMALETYRRKRDFASTPEPPGKSVRSRRHRFVVQEHNASTLHWDLRLEMGGVLKSWAVPKGVPMEAHVRRLAIMTEDHPVEYLSFYGNIPAGSYGAGEMSIWDDGTYDIEQTGAPEDAIAHGKLSIVFHGNRMDGFWEMVKTGADDNHWLLFKVDRGPNLSKKRQRAPKSNVTNRDLKDISGAVRAAMPTSIKQMLAMPAAVPFSNPEWIFELKWDGYRALCYIERGKGRLVSRNQLPLDSRFPELEEIAKQIDCDSAIIDGEIVGLDKDGKPHFQLLQNRGYGQRGVKSSPRPHAIIYYAFDLLYLNGMDLTAVALVERKELLKSILQPNGPVRFSDHVAEKGTDLFAEAKAMGLEGIVAKKADSRYIQSRSDRWRKVKAVQTADVVIGGYTDPAGSRSGFGALLVGLYGESGLIGVGRAGSGFDRKELDRVYALLKARERASSPFTGPLPGERGAHWVEPELVCEVKFTEMTNDGQMRHPTYLRMRDDKDPRECTIATAEEIEAPPPAPSESATANSATTTGADILNATVRPENVTVNIDGVSVKLTHLKKIYWPAVAKTKGDLLAYYNSVSETVLPYVRERPLILQRYPNGVDANYFFQHDVKNPPAFAAVFSDQGLAADVDYIVCNNLATLLYVANLGVIPLHPLPIRRQNPATPDWIVFDLDPEPKAPFESVCHLAVAIRDLLKVLGLESFAKTSGSAGMHVYVPIEPELGFDDCVQFATVVARSVQQKLPETGDD